MKSIEFNLVMFPWAGRLNADQIKYLEGKDSGSPLFKEGILVETDIFPGGTRNGIENTSDSYHGDWAVNGSGSIICTDNVTSDLKSNGDLSPIKNSPWVIKKNWYKALLGAREYSNFQDEKNAITKALKVFKPWYRCLCSD